MLEQEKTFSGKSPLASWGSNSEKEVEAAEKKVTKAEELKERYKEDKKVMKLLESTEIMIKIFEHLTKRMHLLVSQFGLEVNHLDNEREPDFQWVFQGIMELRDKIANDIKVLREGLESLSDGVNGIS